MFLSLKAKKILLLPLLLVTFTFSGCAMTQATKQSENPEQTVSSPQPTPPEKELSDYPASAARPHRPQVVVLPPNGV